MSRKPNHPRVITIGGGTGNPIVNEALLLAGLPKVTSIVSVMDSGGITGRMRTDSRGEEIAYSDGLRTFLSLIDPKTLKDPNVIALKELLRKRNSRGHDLGYTIFSHYFNRETGFDDIKNILERLSGIVFMGRVVPATLKSTNIEFRTRLGITYNGEHELDDKRMSADEVEKMWLSPPCNACPQAIDEIEKADLLFFTCGSLYGSILANLLPKGVKEALKKSEAVKVLVTNLASVRNETHGFTPRDFIKVFKKYTGLDKPIDIIVAPKMTRVEFELKYPKVAERYKTENSFFLGWEPEVISEAEKETGVKFLTHSATIIDPRQKRIRHDPKKLAKTFRFQILSPE